MPTASLMVALTPHMSHLTQAMEEHIDKHASSHSHDISPDGVALSSRSHHQHSSQSPSPSRVTFSVERRPAGFSPARDTSCTLLAEIVVRGELPPADPQFGGGGGGPFEQLMWARRYKVGNATRIGETILEHRVVTVEVPEEIFRYAERTNNMSSANGQQQQQATTRKARQARQHYEATSYSVAPIPSTLGGGRDPKKSDLYTEEELEAQYSVVDELPDGCTFHLMCTLEIVRDPLGGGGAGGDAMTMDQEPSLLRRGVYEAQIDPIAFTIGNASTLLPVEMFAPFVEESPQSLDIVAFASVFAVIGEQLAAATHGDDSNPSLLSSFVALALAAQYDHMMFNVFRPELVTYRQGMQLALNRTSSVYQQQQQQLLPPPTPSQRSPPGGNQAGSPPPARPGPHVPKVQMQHRRQQQLRQQRQELYPQGRREVPASTGLGDTLNSLSGTTNSQQQQQQQQQHRRQQGGGQQQQQQQQLPTTVGQQQRRVHHDGHHHHQHHLHRDDELSPTDDSSTDEVDLDGGDGGGGAGGAPSLMYTNSQHQQQQQMYRDPHLHQEQYFNEQHQQHSNSATSSVTGGSEYFGGASRQQQQHQYHHHHHRPSQHESQPASSSSNARKSPSQRGAALDNNVQQQPDLSLPPSDHDVAYQQQQQQQQPQQTNTRVPHHARFAGNNAAVAPKPQSKQAMLKNILGRSAASSW